MDMDIITAVGAIEGMDMLISLTEEVITEQVLPETTLLLLEVEGLILILQEETPLDTDQVLADQVLIEVLQQEVIVLLLQEELLGLIKIVHTVLVEAPVQHLDIIVHRDLINITEILLREVQLIEVVQAPQEEVLALEQPHLEHLLIEAQEAEVAVLTALAQEAINLIEALHLVVAAIVEDQAVVATEVQAAVAQEAQAVLQDHLVEVAADLHQAVVLQVEEDNSLYSNHFSKKNQNEKEFYFHSTISMCNNNRPKQHRCTSVQF